MMSQDIYREAILDHSKHPRNKGTLEHPDFTFEATNPLCGDEIRVDLHVEGDRVAAVRFSGRGCAISQAAASMLTEMVDGQPVEAVKALTKDDILEELGVPVSPARLKCALLGLKVMKAALYGVPPRDEDL